METGLVFDIQRCCIHDGPGIRTTVFLKGCPLHCEWCHNPESQRFHREVFFQSDLCVDCGACDAVCPNETARATLTGRLTGASQCRRCFQCAAACVSGAIEAAGKSMTVAEVLAEVLKDAAFYNESGGGVTLSGGEPMAQFSFTLALLEAAKGEGLHTVVETCGYAPAEQYRQIVPYVGLFLWDIKDTDPNRHRQATGVSIEPILVNLKCVDAAGASTVLRCVLLNGFNLTAEHIEAVAALFHTLEHCQGVELLPFHPLGVSKLERLGISRPLELYQTPSPDQLAHARQILTRRGVPCIDA